MNFRAENIPGQGFAYGTFAVIGFMMLIGVGMFLYLRRKKVI